MSDIHILEQSKDGKGYKIAYHFGISAGSNNAVPSVAWNLIALIESGEITLSQVSNIESLEQIDLDNGDLAEVIKQFRFSGTNISDGTKLTEVRDSYDMYEIEFNNYMLNKYDQYGRSAARSI